MVTLTPSATVVDVPVEANEFTAEASAVTGFQVTGMPEYPPVVKTGVERKFTGKYCAAWAAVSCSALDSRAAAGVLPDVTP